MNITQNLVPHILSAITCSGDQQERLTNIVRYVEDKLRADGIQIKNLKDEVQKGLQIGTDFGLLAAHNNVYRLKFNPTSKPPFGVEIAEKNRDRENRRSRTEMDDENDEDECSAEEEEAGGKGSTTLSLKKSSGHRESDHELWRIPKQVSRRRRRRSRGGRRKRSRSRRRRRR